MKHQFRRQSVWLSLLLVSTLTSASAAQSIEDNTVRTATSVLDEIMAIPAQQIPRNLLSSAHGVAIIPGVVKGGFVIGVRHGRGVVLLRDDSGRWRPPAFMSITGGSVGWQAGIQSTDVILVFKTRKSVDTLMNGKLTIGVDAAGAAGPVGRQASAATDARLRAEILSYSRSRGLFAGVSFDGSGLQINGAATQAFYGRQPGTIPPSAVQLMNRLSLYSGTPQVAPPSSIPQAVPQPNPPSAAVPQFVPQPTPQAVPSQSAELVRQQLVGSWQRLSAVLDPQWTKYLAPPPELLVPGGREDMNAVIVVLQRYGAVATDSRFASLSSRPEFALTYQQLREYVTLRSKSARNGIPLPPPPSQPSVPTSGRY